MINSNFIKECRLYIGLPTAALPVKDMFLGSLAALIATLGVIYFSQSLLEYINVANHVSYNIFVLTSIAATSVLVFAVPHGALSQPWQVIGGHLVSALVGVLCWQYFGEYLMVAAAISVSLAILLMSYFRCIHPPGGATALGAVLGGEAIHNLGFTYILFPTLLNCIIVIAAAVLLNYPFNWRRYPSHFYFKNNQVAQISPGDRQNEVTIEDFMKSISEHGSYIDITDEGWVEIFENAKRHAELDHEHPTQVELGLAYSNGKLGKQWQIREVLAIENKNVVKFEIVAGNNLGLSGQCSVKEFLQWAKFNVDKNTFGVWSRKTEYT